MANRSLFIELGTLQPDQIVGMMEEIRTNHRGGHSTKDRVNNLVLTKVGGLDGNLYHPQIDAIRPYLPGGSKPACDNYFVGSNWVPWIPDTYGADKSQWYNHYAFWGGILNPQYRWDNIVHTTLLWEKAKSYLGIGFMNFYVEFEADLTAFSHSALSIQVKLAYEAYLIELRRRSKVIEPASGLLWSPFHWDPFSKLPPGQRTLMRTAVTSLKTNVQSLGGANLQIVLQDSVGARAGVITQDDAAQLCQTLKDVSPEMNVEWFTTTSLGIEPFNARAREDWYKEQKSILIGPSWELRWFSRAHSHVITTPTTKSEFLTRAQWGATVTPLGYYVPPYRRTELHIHHTAAIDGNDTTPNRWDRAEAIRYMKALQTARPDLGKDIPYNFVAFVLEDLSVLVCEGRGLYKTGAHTAGHNTAGIAISVGGNFDKPDPDAAAAFLAVVKNDATYWKQNILPNLCSVKNPKGWDLWGHRDSSNKSCPGNTLYPLLAGIKIG